MPAAALGFFERGRSEASAGYGGMLSGPGISRRGQRVHFCNKNPLKIRMKASTAADL